MFRNAQHGGGTEISKQRFLEGRFDHPRAVTPARSRDWQVVRGVVPVVPTDANLRFSDRPVAAPLALRTTALHGTFAGNATLPQRTPIAQQRAAIADLARTVHPQIAHPASAAAAAPAAPVPAAQMPATQRSTITTNATQTAPKRTIADPWTRFGTERGAPNAHHVTVIDGSATTSATAGTSATNTVTAHPAAQSTRTNATTSPPRTTQDGGAWKRFDAAGASRPAAAREPVMVHDAGPAREPQYAAPVQHQPQYSPPQHQPQYSAPAAAPQQQPVRSAAAPAHANPPSQAQHSERSAGSTHH
jgi:hypothetical protein